MKSQTVTHIVIVGGGTAGWLSAALLAASAQNAPQYPLRVTLVESPNIPTIGVGEGTWPSMRSSLQAIGIKESQFLSRCSASFKQGTEFIGWNHASHHYVHPFTVAEVAADIPAGQHWSAQQDSVPFADRFSVQGLLAKEGLAPKQATTPEYAFALNYGYHLNAGEFAELLREHSVENLGVELLRTNLQSVDVSEQGIESLMLESGQTITADLFVDCTGSRSLLLGEALGIANESVADVLFNDRAVAIQAPYSSDSEAIPSLTKATAHDEGWIWDIALQTRRGTGIVYSSRHLSEAEAEQRLRDYLEQTGVGAVQTLDAKHLEFNPSHKKQFWHKNCVAIGMAAGFLEPLEATAIVLVEESAKFIARNLPCATASLPILATQFNRKFLAHWENIVEFLKLHYVFSQRDSDYWQDHINPDSWPMGLADKLALWGNRQPSTDDFASNALFPSASYQYIFYGITGNSQPLQCSERDHQQLVTLIEDIQRRQQKYRQGLPTNRALLQSLISAKTSIL
ncbi:tryptophan halogenase family protein [uncultured Umboniibacter sp.]|uniref:tryptophan halogenase family protein n=1 Tax=uncultured Umboniibacter sp. TaxID=1798917 RepID=UPI00261AC720|nr:tryptophan halogenase family protein [uncultured Umboniibacter sp.]